MDPLEAAFLLSVIGISNTVARLILGWLSDQAWINRLYLYNFCLVICGISMALSPFMTTYTAQAIYCALFGITSGAYVGLTSVVLVDLLGLDKLTNAFGLLLMFQGIASVMGPPIIGECCVFFAIFFYLHKHLPLNSKLILFVLNRSVLRQPEEL